MIEIGWPLAALLAGFAAVAALVAALSQLGDWRSPLTAAVRAVVQLAAVSLVIHLALNSLWWTAAFIAGMVVAASITAARRITGSVRPAPALAIAIAAGLLPTLALALLSGVLPAEPIAVLPAAGILAGGAMSASTLAGRRISEELTDHRGAYEAALSLGFTRRQAVGIVARTAAGLALIPGLDQTRTVGLVTLPGAFVGVLLAGATPVQAGAAQAFVLVALLAVQAIAAAVVVELVATGRVPVEGAPLPL